MRAFFIIGLAAVVANLAGAAEEKKIDVSTIVVKTDAEKILGEPVNDARIRNMDGQDGYYSKCTYSTTNPGKSLILRVYQAAPGAPGPRKQFEMLKTDGIALKPVTGLGDKAGVFSGGTESGPVKGIMLYVARGSAFVTVGVGGIVDEVAALDKAKGIARKILAKL
jgi:hypothetical protein